VRCVMPIWSPPDHHLIRKETMENMGRRASSPDNIHTSRMFTVFPAKSIAQCCCTPACLQQSNPIVLPDSLLFEIATAEEGWHRFARRCEVGISIFLCCCGTMWRQIDFWRSLSHDALRLPWCSYARRGQESFMVLGRYHLKLVLSNFGRSYSRQEPKSWKRLTYVCYPVSKLAWTCPSEGSDSQRALEIIRSTYFILILNENISMKLK
jgi:hypothetical protein